MGCFGESITYNPDRTFRSMVDDVRPFLVQSQDVNGRWNWTGNVGGADFLQYRSAVNQPGWRRQLSRMRASYRSQGPGLTDVVYSGVTLDGAIGADITRESLWSTPQADLPADGITRIGICAGAEYGPAKRWPMERFAAVAQQVSASRAEVQWQLFGAPGEKAMGEQLSTQLGSAPHANLVGKTSLNELIARLKQCRLLLTNDTGTMHLAAALGVPTVSIFGSTCPVATGPLGTIRSGALERANVDVTEELVALISAQRNFQANAKAIETASNMTQAIVSIR
jgi:flagellar basal body rod protein FlgB